MKTLITAILLAGATCIASLAAAQSYDKKPGDPTAAENPVLPIPQTIVVPPVTGAVLPGGPTVIPDGRAMASDAEVAAARHYYRGQCNRYANSSFCECVTAGVAQALAPAEVRMAARTVGERISAQGDAEAGGHSDATPNAVNSIDRIQQIEGHYADACQQFRS